MHASRRFEPGSGVPCGLNCLRLNSFDRLGLSAPILQAIGELGFDQPTTIQEQAIPLLLGGDRDFIGLAQTGTGKTAAFALPMLEMIDTSTPHVQALILAPTRELGQQIAGQVELFAKQLKGLRAVAVYGGAHIVPQMQAIRRGAHVVIATPGRLLDLARRQAILLDQIQLLILDEADEMLNMGFQEDLDAILALTPETKRTWLFSATMPKEIRRMVKQYMDQPHEVRVDPSQSVNTDIAHQYVMVRHTDKADALMRFMDADPDVFGVVFCRTKRDAQDLAELLMKLGYRADALHGDLSQPQRDRVMQRFKRRELQVLIATDVAARGIDVNDVTHVFHYSLPNDDAYYTHRSGRTARAGKKGISIAFINRKEKATVNRMSRALDIEFEEVRIPSATDIAAARVRTWAEEVKAAEASPFATEELLALAAVQFMGMSAEELLEQLVRREVAGLRTGKDLNFKDDRPEPRQMKRKSFKPGFDEKGHKKKFGKKFEGTSNRRTPSPFKPKGRK